MYLTENGALEIAFCIQSFIYNYTFGIHVVEQYFRHSFSLWLALCIGLQTTREQPEWWLLNSCSSMLYFPSLLLQNDLRHRLPVEALLICCMTKVPQQYCLIIPFIFCFLSWALTIQSLYIVLFLMLGHFVTVINKDGQYDQKCFAVVLKWIILNTFMCLGLKNKTKSVLKKGNMLTTYIEAAIRKYLRLTCR